MAASDDQAANDFVLTVPRTNCITEVRVMGEYPGGTSEHPAVELLDAAFRRFSMCRPAELGPPQDG